MRQAGRYLPEYRALRTKAPDFLSFCLMPELAAEATLQPIRRFAFDAAIVFSDILVVPYALGQRVGFREGEGPSLEALTGESDIRKLEPNRAIERIAPVQETLRQVRTALPKDVALIGFAGAPWTVATYMVEGGTSRDFIRTKRWAFSDPTGFAALIDRLVSTTTDYLLGQIEAGAEAIQLFDSWAGVLPEAEFRRWVIEPTARITSTLKARYPSVPIIGFPRGAGVLYEAYTEDSGVDAVSLDSAVPLAWAREHLQARHTVQGNLDPVLLLTGGPAMAAAVRGIVTALRGRPFVFNLGHGILPETPPEHVTALVEHVRGGAASA
ncbi:MAG TPA: uroporphyrinogen decarboxylase [Stellaceae bacterium]|nr:uroporphyrinogen decarboxylase [Stellaceae bacterium]